MRRLVKTAMAAIALAAVLASTAAAQMRGVVGVGLSVPVGEFADESGAGAQAGGGTALAGLEWLPEGRSFGLRLDGAYNRFCTSACDEAGGDLEEVGDRALVVVDVEVREERLGRLPGPLDEEPGEGLDAAVEDFGHSGAYTPSS